MECHSCHSNSILPFCTKNGYELLRCSACGMAFVHPMPKSTVEVYGENYFHKTEADQLGYTDYDADKETMRHLFVRYLKKFEALTANRAILDVGCATGYFLALAKERGWQTYGIDISPYAAEVARSRGHAAAAGLLPQMPAIPPVGVITMWDVLEHVGDPRAYLKAAHERLAPRGYLAISTPDASSWWAHMLGSRWQLIVPPEHLFYYTPESLRRLLEDSGFEVTEIRKPSKHFSLPYIFSTAYRWQGVTLWKWLAHTFDRPLFRRIAVPVNLRDNMFVLAYKKNDA